MYCTLFYLNYKMYVNTNNGQLFSNIYDNRDDFDFSRVIFAFFDWNISTL